MIKTINPHTEQKINEYEQTSSARMEQQLVNAKSAQTDWVRTPIEQRVQCAAALGEALLEQIESLAQLCTNEMGKPIKQARQEVEKCALACRYYAEHGVRFLQDEPVSTEMQESFICYRPLGTILCVMPWNFPYWQVVRVAVPALIAGNGVLLKHASNTTGSAALLTNIINKVFPEHLFQQIIANHSIIEKVIADERVHAVSLTGSEGAGAQVAATAGKHLKKSVLELGGSDPYLILPDADLQQAAEVCVNARLLNNGQSCIAAKRFIVCQQVYSDFVEVFLSKWQAKTIGDPSNPQFEIGPLARQEFVQSLNQQIQKAQSQGATAHESKHPLPERGFYLKPTVLTNVTPEMAVFQEETFGPLAAIATAADEREAIQFANRSKYGLGAAIFTADTDRAKHVAKMAIEAGFVAINTNVRSDPRLPFGGIKTSGFGRELSKAGIMEFVNVKTITVQ